MFIFTVSFMTVGVAPVLVTRYEVPVWGALFSSGRSRNREPWSEPGPSYSGSRDLSQTGCFKGMKTSIPHTYLWLYRRMFPKKLTAVGMGMKCNWKIRRRWIHPECRLHSYCLSSWRKSAGNQNSSLFLTVGINLPAALCSHHHALSVIWTVFL